MAEMVVEALESPLLVLAEAVTPSISLSSPYDPSSGSGGSSGGTGSSASATAANIFDPLSSSSTADEAEFERLSDTQAKQQFGLHSVAETVNGRFAMLGFLGTTLLELLYGHPVVHIMGLR
jgi:hypothetical protein